MEKNRSSSSADKIGMACGWAGACGLLILGLVIVFTVIELVAAEVQQQAARADIVAWVSR